MLTHEGVKLIEYNCRFGDPECQVLMMRLESDLVDLLHACAEHRLAAIDPPRFSPQPAVTVVVAAEGYPGTPRRGGRIEEIPAAEAEGARVFQAGTAADSSGALVAAGGRVLSVTARATSVAEARDRAYAALDRIRFEDGFCRRDIGWREVAREREKA
jgi:phosphoribosylamine---glycine ligase